MAGGQEGRCGTVPAQKVQERPFAFQGEWYYCFIDKRSIHRGTGGDVMSKGDIGGVGCALEYRDASVRREGVDRMLSSGEIDFLYITHEHVDHFWGLPAALKYAPGMKILIPTGFSEKSKELVRQSGHTGKVVELGPEAPHVLFPGCASVTFDIPIFLKTRGEQVLYFHVEGRGMVTVTGCCHQGVLGLLEYARESFDGFTELHAVYGGVQAARLRCAQVPAGACHLSISAETIRTMSPIPARGIRSSTPWMRPNSSRGSTRGTSPSGPL